MNTFAKTLALTLSLTFGSGAEARDTVIALSHAQSVDALEKQTERVILHLLQTLESGETARFYDATAVKLIGTFTMPEDTQNTAAKRVLNHNREVVGKIGAFVRSAKAVPGNPGRINFPELLRTVRETAPAAEDGADLIVLGHPLHLPASVPSQSMLGGRVPSDGHVAATPGQSLYAASGLSGSLAGYDVYFGLLGDNWSVSPPYAHHVTRFWTISVEAHGGSMAYIGGDLETVFDLAGRDAPDRPHDEPLRGDEKLEMLTFAADAGQIPDIYRRPLEVEPAPEPIWKTASGVTIGITWDVDRADLDLYVRPNPQAPVIFFQQTNTPEGRLFKDFTLSPGNGFETVALKPPVDLSQMRLAVNYYGGTASRSGVSGEVRIAIGDQVWAMPIHVPASKGNKGAGAARVLRDHETPNDAWILIDPLQVIGAG